MASASITTVQLYSTAFAAAVAGVVVNSAEIAMPGEFPVPNMLPYSYSALLPSPRLWQLSFSFGFPMNDGQVSTWLRDDEKVCESIHIDTQRAAIALADELSYLRAAERLKVTSSELKRLIASLERQLSLDLFRPMQTRVELTKEGVLLVRFFRKTVTLHD